MQTWPKVTVLFCDLTQFRAADVCIENAFCLYASTRDPRETDGRLSRWRRTGGPIRPGAGAGEHGRSS
jgi:hypothetical protein